MTKSALMYISNNDKQNYPTVENNYWLKRFATQLNKPTNQNSIKVVNPTNKKT